MSPLKKVIPVIILIMGCSGPTKTSNDTSNEQFAKELAELKEYFQIPGMAVLIQKDGQTLYEDYIGFADIDQHLPMDSTTTIPMASLTKIFAGTLIWKLVDKGKVSLEEPIGHYVDNNKIPDSIKIGHVLSHTSQGILGEHFYYNNSRFALLGNVIEKASGKSFKSNIYDEIINPLELTDTYLMEDSLQVATENRKMASPYFLGGEVKEGYQEKKVTEGFIDYGYSPAAGISSTVRDLARFSDGLDHGELITTTSLDKMFTPYQTGLSYGLGIFSQKFMDEKLVWGYGQYDCYSSLLLKVPDKNLVFVIAANNNLMSDPARLIAGDVGYSLFALSFLKNFVFDLEQIPLIEDVNSLSSLAERITSSNQEFYQKKLVGQAVAASFMTRFDDSEGEMSKKILRQVFDRYPNYQGYADLILLHNLNMLKSMDLFRGKGDYTEFDEQLVAIGKSLLNTDPFNPYANYYMANYYDSKGIIDSTAYHFKQITSAKNFSSWWYTKEAEQWVMQNEKRTTN